MTTKKYELTEEDRARLPGWRDKWIANAMSTAPMTDEDREVCRKAVVGLYDVSGLKAPSIILFAKSPLAAVTLAAFVTVAREAKLDVDRVVAQVEETISTRSDAGEAWYDFPSKEISALAHSLFGEGASRVFTLMRDYTNNAWQGGNHWSGEVAYISFFRYVARLDIDYSKWQHWEILAERSGPRIVLEDICVISDRPEVLTVDSANRPHSDSGPFQRWRDGVALYSHHGVRLPKWVVENPERITVELIDAEQNAEVRRVMMGKFGVGKYVQQTGADVVHADVDQLGYPRRLLRKDRPGEDPIMLVELTNSSVEPDGSRKIYHLRVNHELRPLLGPNPDGTERVGEPQDLICHNAVASTFGLRGHEYSPSAET